MTIIIGGHGLGLQDASLGLLNRNDQTGAGTLDQRMQAYANVSDGNLVIQERDVFLPSRGEDFDLVRTYNSRGAIGGSSDGWSYSTAITLSRHQDKPADNGPSVDAYVATYGDGSVAHFDFDASRNLWVSTDGTGAYETLEVLAQPAADGTKYRLTRADQSQFNFDKDFVFISMVDTNGVRTDFTYQGGRIQTVRDDTGHVITYQYDGIGKLASIVDELGITLVRYTYSQGQLSTVTDRFGHVTTYSYNSNGLLAKISLPFQQTVNGQLQTFDTREIQFTYQQINWDDHPHFATPFDSGNQWVLTSIIDPKGGMTTFENNFVFSASVQPGDRDLAYKQIGGRFFAGGTTRVVDAMGNGLTTSNAPEFQQKRLALGFAADVNALTQAQKDTLRQQFSVTYTFDPDGYITEVTDQQGFKTTYTYGGKTAGDPQTAVNQDNLLSVTDRNGWGATNSDSAYFRALRKDLGFVDAAGNGKLVANLTAAEKSALLAKFTTTFTYDARGNVLTSTDGLGNQTSFTYTAFNKIATATAAMGNALATLDDLNPGDSFYRNKRVELGFPNVAASSLSAAQRTALRTLYTTTFEYDGKQNLIAQVDPGGDRTEFEYDTFGNLTKRTVIYRDATNTAVPAKNQVRTYAYDQFGNNVSIVDGEGNTTTKTYDHFGNLLTMVDGRGGVTTFTYDADNRLLTTTDPEGHVTVNTYDAVGNRISVTDENGHTVTLVYDRNNLLIASIDPAVNAALTHTTMFKYDILGSRTETTDAEGRKTTYTFDARRQLVDVATPQVLNGSEALVSYHTTYAYDGESNLVTRTDDNGNVTQILYTPNGLLKRETDPIGNVTEYLHDANLAVVQITIGAQLASALRRVFRFSRDEEDQTISETDALGNVTSYGHDAPGNVVSITDANGHTTDYEFDRNNRLIKETRPTVTDPLTGLPIRYTVLHQYDANGNEVSITDENGNVTTYAFDRDNRAVMVTDGNGIKTVFSWDSRNNQTQVAIGVDAHLDGSGHVVIDSAEQAAVTSHVYDEFGQIIASTDAVGNALVSSDLPLYQNLRTELGFSPQVAGLSPGDKTNLLNRFTERYEYDRVGNRTKLTDHLGRITTLTYDALNREQTRSQAVGTTEERTTALRYDGNSNLVKVTDALGRTTRLTYDAKNRLVDETDPLGVVTHHDYDHVGNVTADTAAFGTAQARTTSYIYDLSNRLTAQTDPEGHVMQYEYDAVGNRLKEIDARGGATQYVYDALNRDIRIIDPLNFQTRFEYDGVGNKITIIDANGGIERLQYDGANRYIQTTDPMGRVTRIEYNRQDKGIKHTTAFGLPEAEVTSYVYDAEGNLRQVIDAAGKVSTTRFDEVYNAISFTDKNGHTTTTAFDALNRQLRVTDALGGVTTYTYDLEDNKLSEADALGRTRSFQYDARNQMIAQTDALGRQTTYTYDAVRNQVSITRAANTAQARTDTFVYNKDDKLISQTDALGNITTYAYDANHNVISTTDALGHTTTYTYDAANQLTHITDPLGHVTQYRYDGKGNRTQVIDARGNATTGYYDLDDEVILKVDGEGNAVANSYDGNGNLVRTTQYMTPLGGVINPAVLPVPTPSAADRVTTFEYDKLNRLIKSTDALGGISTMAYDAVSNRIGVTDQNGHTSSFAYDALDRLTSQTNPLGGTRSFTYDAVGNQLSETDENGRVRSFVYDLEDRRIRETDPLGGIKTFTYDAVGNQLSTTDENGHTTGYAYDLDDRLISETNPLLGVKTYTYDAVGNQLTATDENGHTTSFAYDADDRPVIRTDPLGGVRTTAYDAVDNIIAETDENGHTTTYAYDKNNRLVTETDPLNGVKSFAYDAVGNQIRMTDRNGHATHFEYDKNDQLIRQTDPLGGERTYRYDAAGNQLSMTDQNGHTTSYVYDANDRLTKQTDPLGGERTYSYDAVGNKLSETDENGHTTSSVYDANDRLTKRTDPLGGQRLLTYDAVGNKLSATDENGHTTSFAYDANDRLIKQIDPLLGERRFTYDAAGNQLSMTDENGHATSYLYDANDRLTKQTDPLGGLRLFTYDAAGNKLSATDENGHTTSFAYDADNRLISQTDPLGGVQIYGYDAVGNRTSLKDENGHTTSFGYDANDRLITHTDALGKVQQYSYDAADNVVSYTDENGHTTTYAYDADKRLIGRTDALGKTRTFIYDAVGNQLSMTDENGHTTSLAYDANDRLIKQIDALGGQRLFTYDAVGNQLSMTDENGHTTSFTYDANDRLTSQIDALGQTETHTYDAVGNQLSMTDENGHTTIYAYDALDRLIKQIDPLQGERGFTYDAVGNQLSMTDENGHTTTYAYDAHNRLIGQTDALGKTRTFAYDAVSNRLSTTDENGHTTSFAYDANDRLIQQTDALGGVMSRTYDGVGNKVSETDENGHTTSFAYDALNRLTTRTDALGKTKVFTYDFVGNSTSVTDENNHTTTFAYDALNRVTSMVDALGFTMSTRYDAVGNTLETRQQLSLANPSLQEVTLHAYDALNRRVSSLSAEGFLTTYEYNAVGHVVKMTAFDDKFVPTAAGEAPLTGSGPSRVTLSSYDANDRLVSQTSPLGFVTRYEYDAAGNRTAMVEAQGTAEARRTEMHYDAVNRVIETVDALGIVTQTVRDAVGNVLEVHEAFGTPGARVTLYQYDANNRVSRQTDALGVVTEYAYDGVGDLTERRGAVGLPEARTERFEYDANRRQTAQINGEGERTTYAYDGVGNRTTLIVAPGLPEQRINRFRYDGENRLIGEIDGNGVETQYQYDGAGNKIKTIQLAAAYDSNGNPTGTYQGQSIAGQQRETLFAYDLDNRLIQVTDPMGGVTQYEVDALGNRTKITDVKGTQTVNTFDAGGRILTNWVQGADHGGVLVTNSYDAFGNIIQSRRGFHDGSDTRQTTYTYDKRDRQTTITEYDKVDGLSPATVFTQAYSSTFEYDAFDNQTKIAQGLYLLAAGDPGYDPAKAALAHPLIATFTYDRHDKLLTSTDGVGNVLAYQNDAYGNRTSQTTGFGTPDARAVTFSYDKADRLTARRSPGTGGVVKFTYDDAGNQVEKNTLQSGSETGSGADAPVWVTEHFAYDGNGRVISQTDGLGVITEHVLDAFGNETATRFAAGTPDERTVRFEFNANNDLTAEIDALGNRTRFEVDKLGNRIAQTDALGFITRLYYNELNQQIATLDPEGFLTTFGRDSAGNVVRLDVYQQRYTAPADHEVPPTPAASDAPHTTRNEYDGANNRIRKIEPDQRVTDFVFDSAGKLRQITDHGSSLPAALALTADQTARVSTFDYDAAGRVTRFTNVDGVTEDYVYDSASNKIRETIVNPHALAGGGSDPARTTAYQYDADNRQTGQIFDPGGLNQTTGLAYDKAGNVIAKTDALGHVTTMTYDLGNRMLSITDPLNAVTRFGYDRIGNRTSVTDALGNVTLLEYDLNNRPTKAILPAVDVFTIRDGLQTNVHPTAETKYDAVGNVIQEIDASGFKSSAFYDGNRNRIAEINGDNVLRTFSYDANGLVTQASLYMTRVDAAAHDSATPPAPPSGEVRTVTSEYDAAGRVTRTIYPAIKVTTLNGVNTSDPTDTTAIVTPEERHAYNAFGERVQSIDRNGQVSFAYFDQRGRAVATVDSAGYLIESAYDDQGNVVQQRKYATPLNLASVSAGTRPTAPGGDVFTVDRTFDAANRLIEEQSPAIAIDGVVGPVRVITRHTYDANGNRTSRTLAADSPDAATEYYYYDAANRQVAIVNDARALHQIGYDANGNKTSIKRFIDPVSASVTLATATLSTLLADITPDATQDQETTFAYDALNREILLTDLMGPGSADDITLSSKYDANSNLSFRTDPEGFVTQTAYDALGHITQTRSPDGNRSFIEYDAAGFKIKAWTGDLGSNQATAATNVTASIGSALSVGWEVTGNQLTSFLVYDTTPHDDPSGYANESGQQGSGAASVDIALTGLSAGSVVFFRVVTVDAAGSRAWTDEFSVTIPVLLTNLSVAQAGSNLEVTARFNGSVTGPELLFGAGQALNNTVAFVLQADGSYKAIVTNPAQGGQGLSYQVRWTANGSTFTTSATPFEAPGVHQAIDGTFIWPVPLLAQGDAQVVLLDGLRQENAFQVNGQLQFTPAPLATGSHVYQVLYGQFVAESHTFTVTNRDHQTTGAPSAPVDVKNSSGVVVARQRTFTFQHNFSSHIEVTLDAAEAARAAPTLQVAFRAAGNTGLGGFTNVAVTRNVNTFSADAPLAPGEYDIKVSYIQDGQEVIVEWRRITVAATALAAPIVQTDDTSPFDFVGLPSSFVNDLSAIALTLTDVKSMTVVARETDGGITRLANGDLNVDPGLYTGSVDPANAAFTVPITTTGSAPAGSAKVDGLVAATYFTEIEWNALGTKIATNEDTGLWRRFGVDANGNTVATRVYGTKADEIAGATPIVTYSAFDARNLEIARFGAKAGVDANGDGIDETSARAVTRVTYDYAGRNVMQLDPDPGALAQAFEYDGVGNLIRHTDGLGFVTQMFYDRRGQEVRRVDARGNSRRFVYDPAGRKVQEIDALNNATAFGYDAFDRQISETDALGHASQMAWDQHDRLVETTDANGNSTKYTYDKRDNRIWTEDANHHFFGQAYDAMGRVTNTYSFQSRTSASLVGQALIDAFNIAPTPTTLAQAIDAVNNAASPFRPALVNEAIAYDIYGNKRSETDAEGRTRFFAYGPFGRLTKQTDEGGRVTTFGYDRFGRTIGETRPKDATVTGAKNISRSYDDNGRLKSVTDHTMLVSTTYTYDVAGNRMHETVTAPTFFFPFPFPARNVTYSYDGLGRMSSWSDSVTGKNLSYAYDAVGNQVRVNGSDGVDHHYSFDANNRVTQILQGASTLVAAYTYDAAGNRKTFNDGSATASYTYDAADRVIRADITPNATPGIILDDKHMTWQYDAVGNVTQYQELSPILAVLFSQTNRYTANNRTQQTSINDQRDPDAKSITTTLNALDKAGRVLIEGRVDSTDPGKVKTTTFTHVYSKDGRELSITATGTDDKTGNTTSTFDANDRLAKLDLGKGDAQDSTEFKLFIYNNDGQILRRFHDDGKNETNKNGAIDFRNTTTQFLYANGNPVGETGTKPNGTTETVLDGGNYSLVPNIGAEFPASSVSEYIVREGDTLQSIAAQLYGNPSLWFVIAAANGLTGSEQLKAGTRLTIPNTIEIGRLTTDTHKVYDESEIVGSRLPNLKSPSSSGNICAIIGAIILAILIAIVAIVVTIVTAGTAAPAAAALLGLGESTVATMIVGVAIGTVVGTVVAAAASAITQGINIAFGLQREFDWKQFAGEVAGGVLSGIGGFIGGTAQAAIKVAKLAATISVNVARLARVAAVGVDVAFQVAGEAVSQAVAHDGRIEQPWMLGVAAAAGIAGEVLLGQLAPRAIRAIQGAPKTGGDVPTSGTEVAPTKRVQFADDPTTIANKPIGDVLKAKDTGVVATLKTTDFKSSDASAGADASLEIRKPSESLAANDNTSSLQPNTFADNANGTLSGVQSPNVLDKSVGLDQVNLTNDMNSGRVGIFDEGSVTNYAEGSLGKVVKNAEPFVDLKPKQKAPVERSNTLVEVRDEKLKLVETHVPEADTIVKQPRAAIKTEPEPQMGPGQGGLGHPEALSEDPVYFSPSTSTKEAISLTKAEELGPVQPIALRHQEEPVLVPRPKAERPGERIEKHPSASLLKLDKTVELSTLDKQLRVNKSEAEVRLDPSIKLSSKAAEKALKSAFEESSNPFASTALGRGQQLNKISGNVEKVIQREELELARLQNQLSKALKTQNLENIAVVQKNGLPETLANPDRVGQLRKQLRAAGLENEAKLSQTLLDQHSLLKKLRAEHKLLTDTANDPVLINSAFVINPTHAVELKRLGLNPSAAGRVGEFTDVRLEGGMKVLGSGALNTVYIGQYKLPGKPDLYDAVFKPEVRAWWDRPAASHQFGIDQRDIRAGYRNVATTRLDDSLGLGGLTTRSEMAIHQHKLGTVSEKALGASPLKPIIGDEPVPRQKIESAIGDISGKTDKEVLELYKAYDDRKVGVKVVGSEKGFYYEESAFHEINYKDPRLRRDLVRLQFMDSIAGQVDRHPGNYFVKQDANGNVLSVKGIDNDLSWGSTFTKLENREHQGKLPAYLPQVVDRETFDSIMALRPQKLRHQLKDLLTNQELTAATARLKEVQTHLMKLREQKFVLTNLEDWSREDVTERLLKKDTSYFARDVDLLEGFRKKNLVFPYPQ